MELVNDTSFAFGNIVGRVNFPHHSLTLIVKGTFDLKPNQKAQPSAEQAFPAGDAFAPEDEQSSGSVMYESDFAYFKPYADLLLTGTCHAPNANALRQCNVAFQVGEKRRLLRVFGNRYWEHTIGKGAISEPQPFTAMPVNYENAFGGEGIGGNPIGKGAVKGQLLPNIEDPNCLITTVNDQPEAAGFGPLHRMWQQRNAKLGTYGGDYLTKRWPWFPEDFDWGFFNAAPTEMQLQGYLKGDETLYFENLHPVHSRYESQLPGLRIRCFRRSFKRCFNGTIGAGSSKPYFEEVAMNLDTLWVDMQEEKLVLVWRGWTEVASEEFAEISHVFVMSEAVEQAPLSAEQAHDLFKEKLAELEQQWAMEPEAPEKLVEEVKEELVQESTKTAAETAMGEVIATETEAPLVDAEALESQVNKVLSRLGIDAQSLPAELKQQIQQQQAGLVKRLSESDAAKLAELERQELEEKMKQQLAQLDLDWDNLPPVSEKAKLEQLRFMQELGFEQDALVGGEELEQLWEITSALLPKMGLDPEDLTPLIERAKKQQEKLNKQAGIDLESAAQPEATTIAAELEAEKIETIKTRAQKGESFAGQNLSGLDLSGMDLQGLDFTGALLVGANLQASDLSGATLIEAKLINANLVNAKLNKAQMSAADCSSADLSCSQCVATNLSAAVLADTKLIGADLSECDVSYADLSRCDASGAKFENANMETANISGAKLDNANLFGADLSDAVLDSTQITSAKLDQITAKDAIFTVADLSNSRFVEAKLSGADFSGATLNDANFQGADLSEASLEKVTAKNINLSHANLDKLRASEGSDFSGAILEQAQGKESIWHGANLNGADFRFSKMEAADFSKAALRNAQCYGADMRFARFIKADLSAAQLVDMNLFKGSLEKALLSGTVFTGSNLYAVEFLDAHLEKTQLHGANVKSTKLQEVV